MYRQERNYENLQKALFAGDRVGAFDFPKMQPTNINIEEARGLRWISFNKAITESKPSECGVHFFIDDYQFERVWKKPDKYISILKRFKMVCSPDFSLYTDFPLAIQIYNQYKNMWLARYWQENGIKVLPTISWSNEKSFYWCFDGIPESELVVLSTIGTQKNLLSKARFKKGLNVAFDKLNPKACIIFTRNKIDFIEDIAKAFDVQAVQIINDNMARLAKITKEDNKND